MPTTTDDRLLSVYLHDHLAGAAGGVELARHAAKEQDEPRLAELADDIEADRESLRRILGALGMSEHHPHEGVSWLVEKAARLKPNGQWVGRSPLTALIELETLRMGIVGKLSGWVSLRQLAERDSRLDADELDVLIKRGHAQAEAVEALRKSCARTVFLTHQEA